MAIVAQLQARFTHFQENDQIELQVDNDGEGIQGKPTSISFSMSAIPQENTFITFKFLDYMSAKTEVENKEIS